MEEFTVTTTELFDVPQEVVAVTTYVVVITGLATGFAMVVLLSPVDGDQE